MKTGNVNKKISELVLRAQCASDGGKGINELSGVIGTKSYADNAAGYNRKDGFIANAIKAIQVARKAGEECNYKYSVVNSNINDETCFIVYFETKIYGEKVQVSFHTFSSAIGRYAKRSHRIKWDHRDSRESAILAYKYYNQNGRY